MFAYADQGMAMTKYGNISKGPNGLTKQVFPTNMSTRHFGAIGNVQDKLVIVSGGMEHGLVTGSRPKATKSILTFSLHDNVWRNDLPDMNQARQRHSCCVLGGTKVYLVGGSSGFTLQGDRSVTTVETYDVASSAKQWDLIDVEHVFSPRDFAAIFPISTTKIAILGG